MNSGNWIIILGIVILLTFAISTQLNSYASVIGSDALAASASGLSELYISVAGIGILIFFFVLFMHIFGAEDSKKHSVLSLLITYIIVVLFVILMTIFMASLAKVGLVGSGVFSVFKALSFPLIPVMLILTIIVLYLIIYFLLNSVDRLTKIKAEK